jgi:hypothetical protein
LSDIRSRRARALTAGTDRFSFAATSATDVLASIRVRRRSSSSGVQGELPTTGVIFSPSARSTRRWKCSATWRRTQDEFPTAGNCFIEIQQIRCLAQFRAGSRARPRLGRGVGIDGGRAGPPVRQTALVRTKHGFEKSRSTPRKKTAMLNFAFAYSPSSARRRLFKMALRLLMADMVRSISG